MVETGKSFLSDMKMRVNNTFYACLTFCRDNLLVVGYFVLLVFVGLALIIWTLQRGGDHSNVSVKEFATTPKYLADKPNAREQSVSQIVDILTDKHQIDSQAKDEQIKLLTQTVIDLSKGQGILGSREQINAAMSALSKGETDKAKKLFSEAITIQKNHQEDSKIARTYRNLGALAFLDDTQQALQAYRRATELDPDNAQGWNNLGHILRRVGELDEAIIAYKKVMTWGEKNKNKEVNTIAYSNLGNVYQERGEFDRAVEFYQQSLLIDEALGRRAGMAVNYSYLGIIYRTRGELDKAVEFHQKALVINESIGSKGGMAINYGFLGLVYKTRGEFDKSLEFYHKALVINQALGRNLGMAIDYSYLGEAYKIQGELNKSLEVYQKALELYKHLGRQESMANTYSHLGSVYHAQGKSEKTIEAYQKALDIYSDHGYLEFINQASDKKQIVVGQQHGPKEDAKSSSGSVQGSVSKHSLKLMNSTESEQALLEEQEYLVDSDAQVQFMNRVKKTKNTSQKIENGNILAVVDKQPIALSQSSELKKVQVPEDLGVIIKRDLKTKASIEGPDSKQKVIADQYSSLGLIYQQRGKLGKAIEFYEKALLMNEELNRQQEMASQYANLGLVYQVQNDLDRAVVFYKKALVINKNYDNQQSMGDNYGHLGVAYQSLDELEKATEVYLKALDIHQSLGQKASVVGDYGNLGISYRLQGKLRKAVEFHRKAIAMGRGLGRKEDVAFNYGNLGVISALEGKITEAKNYWKISIKLFRELKHPKAQQLQSLLNTL